MRKSQAGTHDDLIAARGSSIDPALSTPMPAPRDCQIWCLHSAASTKESRHRRVLVIIGLCDLKLHDCRSAVLPCGWSDWLFWLLVLDEANECLWVGAGGKALVGDEGLKTRGSEPEQEPEPESEPRY
ncbi:hypothetical protein IFR05_016850 [Cadophora sp. M221]|nr:hypothetical protein IFR05_016850 [Cadophora sp. M221]